jgi:hypothetical protein
VRRGYEIGSSRRRSGGATGLEISFAYEDLVFPEHSSFLFQFDDLNAQNLFCFFHKECDQTEKKQILKKLTESSLKNNCTLIDKGRFNLNQNEEEKIDIEFIF